MRGRRMKKLFDAINLLAQPCGATIKDLANDWKPASAGLPYNRN